MGNIDKLIEDVKEGSGLGPSIRNLDKSVENLSKKEKDFDTLI